MYISKLDENKSGRLCLCKVVFDHESREWAKKREIKIKAKGQIKSE